ncbi:hypothetical protein [Paracoccus shandongensis]|uniref:hypothetical protein n=1 Tax=Paracoccus shandongensis TaxID=2816048 RepID=UPI001A8CBD60|nr:hypothetical protein [Paracoccus shandongensis]
MNIPTIAPLPSFHHLKNALNLSHDLVAINSTQRRLIDRMTMRPVIDLDAYRFRAVIDWIEFKVHFGRRTQVQHVQEVLRRLLSRDSHIKPVDPGPGSTFNSCSIRVQEPESMALIEKIHVEFARTFGEAAGSLVTGIEISVDAYPKKPSDRTRATLLGALQRTIWTDRDLWSNPDSRPRTVFDKGSGVTTKKLSPGRDKDSTGLSRLVPENHDAPFIDGTMYLGARDDDVMIRIMDKVKDRQRPDLTYDALSDNRKRVRIEVTLKGSAPFLLGITDVPSLRRMKITSIKKRFFQFKIPTFSRRTPIRTGADLMHNAREVWRAQTYLRAGIGGLMTMEKAGDAYRKTLLPDLRKTRRTLKRLGPRKWGGKRLAPALVSWTGLNQKVDAAIRQLDKREKTAWKERS